MKDGAIIANTGHFNVEIDIPALEKLSVEQRAGARVRRGVHPGRRPPHLPAGRRPAGQPGGRRGPSGGGHGHELRQPVALAAEYMVKNHASLEKKVYVVPKDIDDEIARLKLATHERRLRHAHRGAGGVPRLLGPGHLSPERRVSDVRQQARAGRRRASGPGGSRLRVRTVEILPRRGGAHRPARAAAGGALRHLPYLARGRGPHQRHDGPRRAGHRRHRGRRHRARGRRARPTPSPDDPAAFRAALEQAASGLLATRPTAVNLRWALDEMRRSLERRSPPAAERCAAAVAAMLLRGRRHPRRRHRPLPAHRRARRGALQGRRPHPHALQRRRPGDGRLRHGARRHPLGLRPLPGRLRVWSTRRGPGCRAPASPPGSSRSRASRTG